LEASHDFSGRQNCSPPQPPGAANSRNAAGQYAISINQNVDLYSAP